MRVTQCMFNGRAALYRVFISPLEQVQAQLLRSTSPSLLPPARVFPQILLPKRELPRHASLIYRHKKRSAFADPAGPPKAAASEGGISADEHIPDRYIMIVNENSKLEGPRLTKEVLRTMDLETHLLRVVSRPPPDQAGGQPPYPICKIMDRAVEKEKSKQLEQTRKEQARKASRIKELELNWAIAPHDLGHRMKQLKGFLQKGYRVEVLFAKKRGSRQATYEEATALVQSVRDSVAEVEGGKEWKDSEGLPLKVMRLYLEARKPKGARKAQVDSTSQEAPEPTEAPNAEEDSTSQEAPEPTEAPNAREDFTSQEAPKSQDS